MECVRITACRARVGGNGMCMNYAGVGIQIWDAYNTCNMLSNDPRALC